MTSTHYQTELATLEETFQTATRHDLDLFKRAIAGASESSLIGVGSGGSFTAASLLCSLHEKYTGRVSRPSTPLEIIGNPTLAASSPVFLVSAEGKNPDITEALRRARHHSARTIHVLTNQRDSPLMRIAEELSDVHAHVFEVQKKDGYLATNSLLLNASLIARAYGELDDSLAKTPESIADLHIGGTRIDDWVLSSNSFVDMAATRQAIVVAYSPALRSIAIDLESKLSEAALMHCQLADFRSFSHGRHLWLASRPDDIAILALTEPSLHPLWQKMLSLFPPNIPTLEMPLDNQAPWDLVAGLIAQMRFVDVLSQRLDRDPGRPAVPQFGRDLYYLDVPNIVPPPEHEPNPGEKSKYEVLGATWPVKRDRGDMRRARRLFTRDLSAQSFRAVVFDYDGTLCSSQRNDAPPPPEIIRHIKQLTSASVVVGIASGRGGSVQECLSEHLPAATLEQVQLGLYNGGWTGNASAAPVASGETSEFLSHVTRILRRLQSIGVPIENIRPTHPYQVSVRFREGLPTDHMWFVIADGLRQSGLDATSMLKSKHSIDILAPRVSKSQLVAHVIQQFRIDPYEILTVGDQGAWPGNDASLLEHRFSLSVDSPSRRLDRGWKLAPGNFRDVDATLWYLNRFQLTAPGRFSIVLD